jgi:hypothetical protein
MATEEDRVTVRTPLTEFAKRVLRAWPQWALADSVALAAQGNERMVVAMPADLKIADLNLVASETRAVWGTARGIFARPCGVWRSGTASKPPSLLVIQETGCGAAS